MAISVLGTETVRSEFLALYSRKKVVDSAEYSPSVLALADGGFAVAYAEDILDGTGTGTGRVILDIYDANGARRGAGFNVLDVPKGLDNPVVVLTQLASGHILVTWENSTVAEEGLRYVVVNEADNTTLVSERAMPGTDTADHYAQIVGLANGGWVLAKQDNSLTNDKDADLIFYDAAGNAVNSVALDNNSTVDERVPVIVRLTNGNIAVAYEREISDNGQVFGIAVEIFDQGGGRVRVPTIIDTTGTQNLWPKMTALKDGGFAVAYEHFDNGQAGYHVAFLNAAGDLLGVTPTNTLPSSELSITTLANGYVYVTRAQTTPDGSDIRGDVWDPATRTLVSPGNFVETQEGIQNAPSSATLANGNVVTAWHDENAALADGNTDPYKSHVSIQIDAVIRYTDVSGEAFAGDALRDSMTGHTAGDTMRGGGGNDTLSGGDGDDALSGDDDADSLDGGAGNDTLDGGAGTDRLSGGAGNDTYLDPSGDTIVEAAGRGTDTVRSTSSFDLTGVANVERLFLVGTTAANGTGNGLANQITGNDRANALGGAAGNDTLGGGGGGDTLNGGDGADRLTGGTQRDKLIPGVDTQADILVFSTLNDSTGVTRDVIDRADFNGEDRIDLPVRPSSFASAIGAGALNTATFNADLAAAVTAARLHAGQAVLFDPSAGDLDQPGMVYLIVDANGIAGYQANQDWVFQLENHTGALDTTDFI